MSQRIAESDAEVVLAVRIETVVTCPLTHRANPFAHGKLHPQVPQYGMKTGYPEVRRISNARKIEKRTLAFMVPRKVDTSLPRLSLVGRSRGRAFPFTFTAGII
jgi:hypothetical protein